MKQEAKERMFKVIGGFWSRIHGPPPDIPVSFGRIQKGRLILLVKPLEEYQKLTRVQKMISLVRGFHLPQEKLIDIATAHAVGEIFGCEKNFGDITLALTKFRESENWTSDSLTALDIQRADAIEALGVLVRNLYCGLVTVPPLDLQLSQYGMGLGLILIPMSSVVLVRSCRYFIEINSHYTFAQIRSSSHLRKEDLIAYLYEIQFLQQKTALQIRGMLEKSARVQIRKESADPSHLSLDEIEAVQSFELIISYLKATIEKLISLIASIHNLPVVDGKNKHSKKLKVLHDMLAPQVKSTPYGQQVLDLLSSKSLDELNSYRTGILHKKGISNLQPHSFAGKEKFYQLPLMELFHFAKFHHAKNSIAFSGVLAMLADAIMKEKIERETPERTVELKREMFEFHTIVFEKMDRDLSHFPGALPFEHRLFGKDGASCPNG